MRKYITYGVYLGALLILVGLLNYATGKVWDLLSSITMICGVILFALYIVIQFDKVKELFTQRSFRYGGNTLAMSIILLIILGIVNFLANRHSIRFDLTSGGQYSLSPQTRQVLNSLDKDVQITGFYQADSQQRMEDLLKTYRFYSTKIKYAFVDPDRKPAIAKQYGITTYGTVVFECADKIERIIEGEEQEITNALIKVTREKKKVIYFLDGHGENNIDDSERTGFNSAKSAIENENYDVQKLLLAEQKSIPFDCAVLIVNGAENVPFQSELDTIQAYLENGGKAFFMLEPEPFYGFHDLLDKWGLKVGNDIVLDASGMGQLFGMGPSVPLVNSYTTHDITSQFDMMTFFPSARSVTPKENTEPNLSIQVLLNTGRNSWGETNLQEKQATFNEDVDLQGPVTLCTVVTKEDSLHATRLVVIGDSDFANNLYFNSQGNGNLFMNIISWLAEEKDLIAIRAKQPDARGISMTAKQTQWMMYLTVILMPLAALIVGVVTYIKRERR